MEGRVGRDVQQAAQLEQGYVPSDEVETAQEIRRSIEALQPEKYKSSFEDELSQLYEQIAQRKPLPTTRRQMRSIKIMRISMPGGDGTPWRTPWVLLPG